MLISIFIANVNEFISVHCCAPQRLENKIISTYKRKPKQAWIGCVVCGLVVSAMHHDF